MKVPYLLILFLLPLFFSCKQSREEKQAADQQNLLEGKLSKFDCSDTLLSQRYTSTIDDFDKKKDLSEPSWSGLLTYARPAKDYLQQSPDEHLPELLWSDYIQTGNKITLARASIWDKQLHMRPEPTDSLLQKLLLYERLQRMAYLALAVKKDSFAQQLFDASNDIFQEELKNQFDLESNSYGQGIDVDLLALYLDLIPEKKEKAVIRNVFSHLLESGMSPKAFSAVEDRLLPMLVKYDQIDLAYRLLPELSDAVVSKWVISDLMGIKPSLSNPGFSNPVLHPRIFRELDFMEGQVKTQYGLLYLRIDRTKPLRIQVKVPAKATIILPITDPGKATILANKTRLWMGGSPQPGPPGTRIVEVAREGVIVEMARGKYDFQIKN